jgi:transglutaminase-like putative cysteine protease
VRYEIAHQLHLSYSAPVWEHHVEVRLTPQHNDHQQLLAAEITIDPTCEPHSYHDSFGNRVHYCSLLAPHDHLTVRMRASVDTSLENPFDYAAIAPARELEWIAESLRAQPRLWAYLLHHSPRTPDLSRLTLSEPALPAHDPGQPVLDAVMAALDWMGETITYEPAFAAAPAKLEDVLAARAGGCQDLAHLLISIARAWGFPARYVMGYQDPGYAEEAEHEQRPHAWAEILIPGAGWRGVDPTTRLVANQTYVAVAIGRDAADAAPIKAVFKGGEEVEAAEAETAVALQVTRDQ